MTRLKLLVCSLVWSLALLGVCRLAPAQSRVEGAIDLQPLGMRAASAMLSR